MRLIGKKKKEKKSGLYFTLSDGRLGFTSHLLLQGSHWRRTCHSPTLSPPAFFSSASKKEKISKERVTDYGEALRRSCEGTKCVRCELVCLCECGWMKDKRNELVYTE